MKKTILLFAFSLVAFSSYAATETITSPADTTVKAKDADKKVEIEAAKLPASVSSKISESHKGATITKSYQHENAAGKVTGYEVIIKTGEKEETLKFDAAGALVK